MKVRQLFIVTLILVLLGGVCVIPASADEKVEIVASVKSKKVGLDDAVVYSITVKGIRRPFRPALQDLKDFKVISTSHESRFMLNGNTGVMEYLSTFTFFLNPFRTGTFTLPPVEYEFEGTTYRSNEVRVEVVKGSVSPPGQSTPSRRRLSPFSPFSDSDNDFLRSPLQRTRAQKIDVKLRTDISKRNPVKGEMIIYRVLLLARNTIRSVDMVSNQSLPGFWQEWFPFASSIPGERQVVEGKEYMVYEVRKAALFPTRTGQLTIPSLEFQMVVPKSGMSMFGGYQRINRSTPQVNLTVSGLPPEAGELPVGGRFSFSVKPDKKEIDINDILTLRLSITSTNGNIKTIQVPRYTNSDYYKVYPPKITRNTDLNDGGVSGKIKAEIPISFKTTGLISFPSLEFKYYDPAGGRVVTLNSKSFNIKVMGAKEKEESAVTIPKTEIMKTGEDIDFIKKGEIYNQESYFYRTGLFQLLLFLFNALNLGMLLKKFVYDRYIAGSELLNRKKVLNKTLNRLKEVKDFGGISTILEDYLKDKSGIGRSGITNQGIQDLFIKSGVNDSDIDVFVRLKSESESYRFSPQAARDSSREAQRKLKHDTKQLMEILKRIDDRINSK